jgi:hypothetical protein
MSEYASIDCRRTAFVNRLTGDRFKFKRGDDESWNRARTQAVQQTRAVWAAKMRTQFKRAGRRRTRVRYLEESEDVSGMISQ